MQEDKDTEQQGLVGWILGIGAFVAVAVSLSMAFMGAMMADKGSGRIAANSPGGASVGAASSGSKTQSPSAASVPASVPPSASNNAAPASVGDLDRVSIYFDVNNFMPPADTAERVDSLIIYARNNVNAKIAISGYADKTGDPAKNAQLAKERALAVRNQLISAGLPEDRIIMQKPVDITVDKTDDRQSRRVDVFVVQ